MQLMHKNTLIAEVKMVGNKPTNYEKIYNEELLPKGTLGNNSSQEQILINHWYKSRSIPNLRPNLHKIEEKIGITATDAFIKSAGVSLTDRYWFKNENKDIKWEDINYHNNGFLPVIASYYANNKLFFAPSPDFTTDGIMEKFWIPIEKQPHLFKFDKKYNNLLCANEIVFYKIADSLGIKTTPYLSGKSEIGKYCFCPCFVKIDNCDYINAMQIKHSPEKTSSGVLYFPYSSEKLVQYFMSNLGFEKEIREMVTLDCLLHNTDRHEKNFGYLKYDNNTDLFAPLFDNGFCLGVNKGLSHIITDGDMKLFSSKREQILQNYGMYLDVDLQFCLNMLESVYKEFDIPEEQLQIAKEELEYGASLVINNNKTIRSEFYNDFEKELL